MSKKVDLPRLTEALTDFDYAFLISVGDSGKPHLVMVDPVLIEGSFDVGAVGARTDDNVTRHRDVTLLWPPRAPGGYALMVDGPADETGSGLRVTPTKALLHRRATPGSTASASGCLHDCVVFTA